MTQPLITIGKHGPDDWIPLSDLDMRFMRHIGPTRKAFIQGSSQYQMWNQWRMPLAHDFSWPEIERILIEGLLHPRIYRLNATTTTLALAGVRMSKNSGFTTWKTLIDYEDRIRKMPPRFTLKDVLAEAQRENQKRILERVLYFHVVTGELEFLPNAGDGDNPSFYKTGTFLTKENFA